MALKSHVSPLHYHATGLLVQFLISDYIETQNYVKEANELLNTFPQKPHDESWKEFLRLLTKLSGAEEGLARIGLAKTENSLLGKLNHTASLIYERFDQKSEHLWLTQLSEKAWISSIQCHEKSSLNDISRPYRHLNQALERFGKKLEKIFPLFKDDENFIFFLIKSYDQLDRLYRTGFVKRVLEKMYPEGLTEVEKFLVMAYHRRGFDGLSPVIRTYFSQLRRQK